MYKNKIVCSLKHNGKPLAENKDTVFMPLNTQYEIYLKNLNDTIAYISIFINGIDISPNKKIILYPGTYTTISSFPKTGHSFVFKEKTIELQQVRDNLDEDGLIRLEIEFQKKGCFSTPSILDQLYCGNNIDPYNNPTIDPGPRKPFLDNGISFTCSNEEVSVSNYSGFTAPGKKIDKNDDNEFKDIPCSYNVDEKFSFIIQLEEAELIQSNKDKKKECPTCSKHFKSTYFYCPYDGTFLD